MIFPLVYFVLLKSYRSFRASSEGLLLQRCNFGIIEVERCLQYHVTLILAKIHILVKEFKMCIFMVTVAKFLDRLS